MRNKVYLIILIMLISSSSAGAQIGIKFGLNINRMTYSYLNDESFQNCVTYQLGGFFTWNLTRTFSIQPELYYSRSGAKRNIVLLHETFLLSEEYTYLRLPLLAKFILLSKGNWSLSSLCGLYGAVNLTANQKVTQAGNEFSDSIRELIKPVDLGFISGLEIGHKIGKGTLLLDFRFSLGLKNTKKTDYSDERIYNRMIVIQLGYRFNN
jgi:hypothetical protein